MIGSFVLNGSLLLYLGIGAAGWLMLKYRFRSLPEGGPFLSCAMNAFWIWMLVWKGSFAVFHPVDFIRQPVSLLYFDGGERGRWAAALAAAAYIAYRSVKQKMSAAMWIEAGAWFSFAGWFVYHFLLWMFDQEPLWFHAVNAGLTAALLIALAVTHKDDAPFQYALWFSIGNVLLLFMVSDRPAWLLTFSKQQIVFLLAAASLTGWSWRNEKRRKGGAHG